jgi:PST family polysaccharide transporter
MRQGGGSVFWSGLEAACAGLLSFASAFLVARLVGPAELGIGAAVVAPHVLLWVAANAVFADAIAQRTDLDDDTASSAFWASGAVGCIAACVQAGLGCMLAATLGDTRLPAMAAVLAAPLPLVGAAGAAQGMLTRRRAYRALAARTVLGQGLGSVIGVCLALAGAGAWAVVVQQAAGSCAGAAVLLIRMGWRPGFRWRWSPVRELLAVGGPLVIGTILQHGRYRLFVLAIGDVAGAAALGEVHLAFRLVDTLRDLTSTALWRLMLPTFAERRNDRAALCGALDRCLGLSGLVMFPLWGALALSAGPLVTLLLGPAWSASAIATLPLIGLACWTSLTLPAGVAAVAHGATLHTLAVNAATAALTVCGAFLLRPALPLDASLLWTAAQLVVAPAALAMGARALRLTPGRTLRAGRPALALAVAATGTGFLTSGLPGMAEAPFAEIVLRLAAMAGVYLTGAVLLLRADVMEAFHAAGVASRTAPRRARRQVA